MDINALERQDVPILRWLAGGWCPIVLSGSGLEKFQEKCDRFSREKRVALSLGNCVKTKR